MRLLSAVTSVTSACACSLCVRGACVCVCVCVCACGLDVELDSTVDDDRPTKINTDISARPPLHAVVVDGERACPCRSARLQRRRRQPASFPVRPPHHLLTCGRWQTARLAGNGCVRARPEKDIVVWRTTTTSLTRRA